MNCRVLDVRRAQYSIMRRDEITLSALGAMTWDIFVSAFNTSDRVLTVFNCVSSPVKHWLVHSEYGFSLDELPLGDLVQPLGGDEIDFWLEFFSKAGLPQDLSGLSICIDATGFMRPHLMVLLALVKSRGVRCLNVLYTDPVGYSDAESTPFTKGAITAVRQVRGFEGSHIADAGERDLIVIGVGYDDQLIRRAAESKSAARKLQLFGLPSLQPHMYQESRLRASRAEEAVGPQSDREVLFAPASNPFVTADVLHESIAREEGSPRGLRNLYLSPLGTKPQVLGFALYYLTERANTATSVVFPFADGYNQETTFGIARIWLYEFELDW
jgi:hypothetical protein